LSKDLIKNKYMTYIMMTISSVQNLHSLFLMILFALSLINSEHS